MLVLFLEEETQQIQSYPSAFGRMRFSQSWTAPHVSALAYTLAGPAVVNMVHHSLISVWMQKAAIDCSKFLISGSETFVLRYFFYETL